MIKKLKILMIFLKLSKSHKPGEKVTVTYLRDDKEQKATAELGKWKGVNVFATTPDLKWIWEI